MLKNKEEKLKKFEVEYSMHKNNIIVNRSIIIESINDPNKIIRLAKLNISTMERIFIQNVKILGFKTV
ncbi:hypothetical protein COE08_28560 [Priestia megaterium]|jgi:hypothetical protein|uniref:Uncharacterized protein n=1 Tax=Priestia megaterium TaxID=1404 RepID=A0AAE5U9Y7_PRIMG|nr:hypothetical protein [Priestia megaterium]PEB60699.1 hypothetical protein COM86_28490 [Priestia megaterium]PEE73921.1 hypothetical protein COM81_25780 [Priestia megaterium]PES30851.1 hypothetical protein CN497_23730 [Priestia megaterium]PFE36553.1 hypothetical protein CN270_03185 [Priestia megaterium]